MKLVIFGHPCTNDDQMFLRILWSDNPTSVVAYCFRSGGQVTFYEFSCRTIGILTTCCLRDQRRKQKNTIFLRIHSTECTEMKAIHHLMKTCAPSPSNRSLLLWPLVSLHQFPCFSFHPFSCSLCSYISFPLIHFSPPPFLLRSLLHHPVH